MVTSPTAKPDTRNAKGGPHAVFAERFDGTVECPWCESMNSKVSNPFGSTVSEIIFTCGDCGETFGWMKWQGDRGQNIGKKNSDDSKINEPKK